MINNKKIAVLISGRGSNLDSLLNSADSCNFKVVCAISNKKNALGLEVAKKFQVPCHVVGSPNMEDDIHSILENYQVGLVCLAGFMKVLTKSFIDKWQGKIVNIHPSLLPSFKGLHAQEQAFKAGVRIAGCTVHFVTSELDSGEIIMQWAVPVLPDDTIETLSLRILQAEHKCYPLAIKSILHCSSLKRYHFMDF